MKRVVGGKWEERWLGEGEGGGKGKGGGRPSCLENNKTCIGLAIYSGLVVPWFLWIQNSQTASSIR
jgi:hypothetical protein